MDLKKLNFEKSGDNFVSNVETANKTIRTYIVFEKEGSISLIRMEDRKAHDAITLTGFSSFDEAKFACRVVETYTAYFFTRLLLGALDKQSVKEGKPRSVKEGNPRKDSYPVEFSQEILNAFLKHTEEQNPGGKEE